MLLLSVRPSPAYLVRAIGRTLVDGLLLAAVLTLPAVAVLRSATIAPILALFASLVLMSVRYRHWRHARLRVTTERILLQHPETLFSAPLRTIKWNQYQESQLGGRTIFDLPFGARSLRIRYGAADSKLYVSFPAVAFASDIKHYLDKVDSAVRKSEAGSLRPFIAKQRGRRDEE